MDKPIKLLIVAEDIIFPENKNGIAKTLFNVLKDNPSLDATLICPENSENIPEGFSHVSFKTFKNVGKRKVSLLSKIKSFLGPDPFLKASEELLSEAGKSIKNVLEEYEVILICSLSMAPLLEIFSESQRQKTAILSIDSYSYWFSFKVRNEKNPLKKLLWWIEMKKGEAYEKKYYDLCALSLYVSTQDAKHAENLGNTKAKKIGMRYGIDLKSNRVEQKKFEDETREDDTLIFTGNLSYGPNLDAINYLLNEILPKLWLKRPSVKIYFLGGGAPDFLKNHHDNRIIVTGFVDSLVPYMKKTSIFVSPLFFGAGTKTKVLEAMGFGKAVVGTEDSFTEIVCENNKSCIIVDPPKDSDQWVSKIIALLDNKSKLIEIEAEAKKTIEENHDWAVNKKAYVEELLKIKSL